MLYVAYIPKNHQTDFNTVVGVFLMESDAKQFVQNSTLNLEITEASAWFEWTGIRNKAFEASC